jgi:outer membrane murein-binding lipoprotein Lpp
MIDAALTKLRILFAGGTVNGVLRSFERQANTLEALGKAKTAKSSKLHEQANATRAKAYAASTEAEKAFKAAEKIADFFS